MLQTLDLLTDPHRRRGQLPQAIRQAKYHDDVRTPVLFVLRYKVIRASWMNAVLQDPKDQDRFQVIRENHGDAVQELFSSVRLGSHQRTRCGADSVRNLPRGPNCTLALVTEWVKEISTYIKGLDPWHLIGVGDEGFFNEPRRENWVYNGTHGVDTEAFVKLDTIDFGTYHIYPVRRPFPSQPCR